MHSELQHTPSLHQVIRQWLPWATRKPATQVVAVSLESGNIEARFTAITIQQLATSIRMRGIGGEEESMLRSLESLVREGEIEFADFIRRLQNLFPDILETLDAGMRMKVASLLRK